MPRVLVDGVHFHVAQHGSGAPLVLLHGFTGSSKSWSHLTNRLERSHRTLSIDLIGHGFSAAPLQPDRYRFSRAVEDAAAIAIRLGIDRAAWLGYSMGGRVALGLALEHSSRVSALILESVTPGIPDEASRHARQRADADLAARIERGGVEWFVQEWETLPLWASQRSLPEAVRRRQRAIRLANRPAGLANSLRGMGQGAQPSLWDRLRDLEMPVLLITGAEDVKFRDIASRMHRILPRSELVVVPDAGHAVHLEQPAVYADHIERFLSLTSDSPRPIERSDLRDSELDTGAAV